MFKVKNTIFKKLVSIFIALLILSFIVTGGFLYYFLNILVTSEKVNTLEISAGYIKKALNMYLKNKNSEIFAETLQILGSNSNSMVWIVNETGHIVIAANLPVDENNIANTNILSKYIDETGNPKLPDPRQYSEVMKNDSTTIQMTGDFFGFFNDEAFKNVGNSWLTVQMPLKVTQTNVKQQVYAIYMHTPVPEVQRLRTSVFQLFIISGGVAIFLSIILVYVFSIRFTRPLKQINNAAKKIAGGEFNSRLVVNTNDEIGQLADSFNQMVDDLQKLEEMRRGFIANVSHELRTPMTSIQGFIEGILDGTIPSERQNYYLTIVKDETNRLNRLVNDLLDLAKMEAGEISLNIKPFDINELIRICVIKLETLITSKNLEIEANFEIVNLFVSADKDSIERVIINLLHNAVKFSNENGKIILETVKNKDKVLISVKDSGIGIDEVEQKRIWDRFFKSDKSRGKDKTGTGLGLAIVKNILAEHKQDIWVESEIGSGTKFTFSLPYYKSNAED